MPNSAENEFVSTWNSRTASWLKTARTEPTMGSLLSSPSTMMLLERARWPANERPEVADAPCCGVWSVVTPGVITEKLMKLRPLMGRLSICCWPTTEATAVFSTSTVALSATVISSTWLPTGRVKPTSADWPSRSTRPSRFCGVKPDSSAVTR